MHPGKKRKASPEESDSRAFRQPVRMQHEAPTYIVETGENDILMGRGKPIINYIGNKKFRELARSRKEEYANSSRSHTKELIAREILEVVRQRGGRFLQRVTLEMREKDQSIPDDPKVWRIVDLNAALSKIKQTLRDREYVPSSERQREAVAFIEEQHRRALRQRPVSSSSLLTVPPASLTGTTTAHLLSLPPFSQQTHLPFAANPSLHVPNPRLLGQLQMLNRRQREEDFCTEQLRLLFAQQQTLADVLHQPIMPNPFGSHRSRPILPLGDAEMLLQYVQSQRGTGLLPPSSVAAHRMLLPPVPVRESSVALGMVDPCASPMAKTPEEDSQSSDDNTLKGEEHFPPLK